MQKVKQQKNFFPHFNWNFYQQGNISGGIAVASWMHGEVEKKKWKLFLVHASLAKFQYDLSISWYWRRHECHIGLHYYKFSFNFLILRFTNPPHNGWKSLLAIHWGQWREMGNKTQKGLMWMSCQMQKNVYNKFTSIQLHWNVGERRSKPKCPPMSYLCMHKSFQSKTWIMKRSDVHKVVTFLKIEVLFFYFIEPFFLLFKISQ